MPPSYDAGGCRPSLYYARLSKLIMALAERLYRRGPIWLQTVLLNGHAVRIHRQRYGRLFGELQARWLESERWEPARLRAWQDERLRQIVRFAYDHVPFYRKRFDARGIKPSDVQ